MPKTYIRPRIKDAKRAYLFPLNKTKCASQKQRYTIYIETPEGLQSLWPFINFKKTDKKGNYEHEELLDYQIKWTRDRKYPMFHFVGAWDIEYKLMKMLKEINPEIEVLELTGFNPCHVRN